MSAIVPPTLTVGSETFVGHSMILRVDSRATAVAGIVSNLACSFENLEAASWSPGLTKPALQMATKPSCRQNRIRTVPHAVFLMHITGLVDQANRIMTGQHVFPLSLPTDPSSPFPDLV